MRIQIDDAQLIAGLQPIDEQFCSLPPHALWIEREYVSGIIDQRNDAKVRGR